MKFLFCFILISLQSALALIWVDISPYDFGAENSKGTRLLYFDMDKQCIHRLVYVEQRPPKLSFSLKEKITIGDQGQVRLQNQFDAETYRIRSVTPITTEKTVVISKKGEIYYTGETPLRSPKEIRSFFKTFSKANGSSKKVLEATFIDSQNVPTKKSIQSLDSVRNTVSQELGRLGEIITNLVFFHFGYSAIPSKYENNHGFDGLYTDPTRSALFITESKFRPGEASSPKKYMKECLSEQKIYETYKRIKEKNYALTEFLEIFKKSLEKKKEATIFKMIQRIKKNGYVETLIVPFSFKDWSLALAYSNEELSPEQQVESLQGLLDSFHLTPSQKQALLRQLH